MNFGINQKHNPDIDVKNLTKEQAADIYRDRYWNKAGVDNAPAAVRGQMFDTAVNMGVDTAKRLLKESGGDPVKFAELRRAEYRAIVAKRPSDAKHLKGWLARVDKHAGAGSFDPPQTVTQAVEIARQTIQNPRDRKEVEARIRFEYQLKEETEREQKQQFAMSAYDTILKSQGKVPLEQLFSPDQLRDAYKFGYIDNFRELQRQQALGNMPQTDLNLYETYKREALLNPASFAKRNLMAVSARLSTDDLGRLMGWQAEIKKPKKPDEGQPEFITEQKQLGFAYTDIGLDGKDSGAKRDEFEKTYYKEVEAFTKAKGRKPDQPERQEIINRMKLPFVSEGWFSDEKVPAYKATPGKDKVPKEERARIIGLLQKEGIHVTEDRIVQYYLGSVGSEL